MDNGNYNIEPIIHRIQETAFTEGYEVGKKEAVKRGHWIKVDYYGYYYECSECKNISLFEHNYCGNCGADMRGERHD